MCTPAPPGRECAGAGVHHTRRPVGPLLPSPSSPQGPESTTIYQGSICRAGHAEVYTPRVEGQPSGTPHLTSDACCAQDGPARSDGPCAHKTVNAPVADLYSNDFSSYIFQNCLPAPVSGSESGRNCSSETGVASGRGTCSPWTSGSSSPWSLCRARHGVPVWEASHCGSASGSVTWSHRMWSRCRFSSS